jgi:hypothetical protein
VHDESEGAVKLNDIWRASETLDKAVQLLEHHPELADKVTLEQMRMARSWSLIAWREVGYNAKDRGMTGGEWDIPDYRHRRKECTCGHSR